jgi:hypothetical protein
VREGGAGSITNDSQLCGGIEVISEVEELEARVRSLPPETLAAFRQRFYEFHNELWDRQIEADAKGGKFTKLIEKARKEFAQGKARER